MRKCFLADISKRLRSADVLFGEIHKSLYVLYVMLLGLELTPEKK